MLKILRTDIRKIHTEIITGPIDFDCSSEENLRNSYARCLNEARKRRVGSIAFPLVPFGDELFAREEGMRIAVDEINRFLSYNKLEVILVVPGERYSDLDYQLMNKLQSYVYDYYSSVSTSVRTTAAFQNYKLPQKVAHEEAASSSQESRKSFWGKGGAGGAAVTRACMVDENCMDYLEEASISQMMSAAPEEAEEDEDELKRKLDERLLHRSDTFTQYLMYLIESKNLENSQVYKRALITKQVFSSMKNDIDYRPTKSTALRFCIGAMLNIDEAKDLLARAGYALSPCDKMDIIFTFFIENGHYDLIDIDIQLEEYGLPCIIS